ncbi:PLP-dependent aminotransferase family protein [Bacillus carboniphilus]|uniref:PLP-dependent aminotransferase family protein n=1 Tax=Bacillus carboniphilus TaxID=86663 RepID=A0ABN0WHV9_9BACI
MRVESFFSKTTRTALKNEPPGEWIAELPDDCIRLSSGYPAPELVPDELLKEAVIRLFEEERDLPLHYMGSPRVPKLREQIQERLACRGVYVLGEELLITSGACQAIDLIARTFIDAESVVALESPTYMEALEIFQNYTKDFMSIPVDEQGLETNLFEEALVDRKQKGLPLPKLLYVIPSFQNPTGTSLSLERRRHVLELASQYNFLIVEDDAYGELGFNEAPTSLKALDKEDRVLHVGSLSKVIAPGMRIGWVAGVSKWIKALAWFKKDLDHPFAQAVMASFLENTDYEKRLKSLRESYQSKCSALTSAIEEHFPEAVSWYVPEGGYFTWVKVPGVDTAKLLEKALIKGVSFVPGKYFFLNQADGMEYLRLSFSYANEEEIVEGIRKLGRVIKSELKNI